MRRTPISNSKAIRPTGDIRAVEQPDGTYTYKVMDEYEEITPAGVPWGHLALALLGCLVIVLVGCGVLALWGWVTGAGITVVGTTCPTHLLHSPLPSALPSVPPK